MTQNTNQGTKRDLTSSMHQLSETSMTDAKPSDLCYAKNTPKGHVKNNEAQRCPQVSKSTAQGEE